MSLSQTTLYSLSIVFCLGCFQEPISFPPPQIATPPELSMGKNPLVINLELTDTVRKDIALAIVNKELGLRIILKNVVIPKGSSAVGFSVFLETDDVDAKTETTGKHYAGTAYFLRKNLEGDSKPENFSFSVKKNLEELNFNWDEKKKLKVTLVPLPDEGSKLPDSTKIPFQEIELSVVKPK